MVGGGMCDKSKPHIIHYLLVKLAMRQVFARISTDSIDGELGSKQLCRQEDRRASEFSKF